MASSTLNASLAVDAVLDYNVHRFQPKPFYGNNAGAAKSITSLNNVHRSQPHRHSHSYSHLSLHNSTQNSISNLSQNLVPNTFQPAKQPPQHHQRSNHGQLSNNNNQNSPQQQQRFKQFRSSSVKDLNELSNGSIKTAQIVLLDGQKLYYPVQPRLFAGDLFDMVANHYNLKEKEYFGLAFINETGTFSWLNLDKRVVEHEFPNTSTNVTNSSVSNKNNDNNSNKSIENESKPFEETQTLNRSSTRRIGELKRKNQALKSKKVTSSLINLNTVQNKLKQKFNSSGMLLGNSAQNSVSSTGIGDVSMTAPNSQCNSRHSSIASVNELELDPIYHEVPFENNHPHHQQPPPQPHHQRSISYSNGLESSHNFVHDIHDDVQQQQQQQKADIVLYFMVKYFVESIRLLNDNVTIQLFYLQAKSLLINEYIQVNPVIAPELGALILQITYGDTANFSLERTQSRIQKWRLISNQVDSTERSQIEKNIIEAYVRLEKTTRAECIYRFMTLIEKEPTYGVHYFEALENKTRQLVWLGISNKGILQFDYSDRLLPVKQFSWKHLENLYFRERKFSIEVRDAKRVVLALSSINLYENAIEEIDHLDDLSSAICDPTTQVSVSRRTFGPSNVTVYVWFATNCQLTKCMWSMAVAQHQFYTERHSQKCNPPTLRTEEDIVRSLDTDKFLFVGSKSNWSKRKSLSSKSSSHRPSHHHPNHYSSMCSVSSSRASSISGSLSNLSDSSSSSLSSEVQTFGTEITRMSRTFKCGDRSRNLISRKLKILERQLNEKLQEIDKLDRLENQLLRKAKSQTNLHQSRPRLQDYLEVVSSASFSQHPHNRASISSTSSSGTSGGLQMIHSNNNNIPNTNMTSNGRPLKASNSITSTNSLRNFVVTGRSSVAGSTVSNNSAENVPIGNNSVATKKLPPLPNQGNEFKKTQTLPLPPLPPSASNISQFPQNQPQTRNSTSSDTTFTKERVVQNLPTFTSPYVDRFEKFVQEEGLNLYSVPNRRTSIAMNSFDDFFIKNGAPKFQSTTSLDTGNNFPNGITSVKSSNLTTDSNSVIYETVTYSSSSSNPGSKIGSRSNLNSQISHSNFSPALVESSVDDECDSVNSASFKDMAQMKDNARSSFSSSRDSNCGDFVDGKMKSNGTIQSQLGRSFFHEQSQRGTFDQQNFVHYKSAFVDRVPFNSRRPEEYIGYSSRPTNSAFGDCQIPIINQPPVQKINETTQFQAPKTYSGTLSQHQAKAPKGWVETDLDGNSIVHSEVPKEEKPLQSIVQSRPLIVQSQKVVTFMPQSVALKHVTHESDSLREPIESSVDDVPTEEVLENHYQEIVSNIPTPSPSPPGPVTQQVTESPSPVDFPPPPPPPLPSVPKHLKQFVPISRTEAVPATPLFSSQVQNNVPSYITNSEPSSVGTKLSQHYYSAALSQSQNANPPVQYHAAPVIVERTPPPPLQTRSIIPSSSVPASVTASPTPSSIPSPVLHKRNSAALLSPTESVMSFRSSNGPLSPLCTVAFVPANVNTEPVNTMANGHFQSNIDSSIPVASCKGNIVEVDIVTVGQFQPGYEEEKPFTMDDFFKYSQKYRNSKPVEEKSNEKLTNQMEHLNLQNQHQQP